MSLGSPWIPWSILAALLLYWSYTASERLVELAERRALYMRQPLLHVEGLGSGYILPEDQVPLEGDLIYFRACSGKLRVIPREGLRPSAQGRCWGRELDARNGVGEDGLMYAVIGHLLGERE